jgi:hypothetical protein|tara:strand:+ start:56 stop:274 length:219 start_codon:yes stop_codon:yes gene_type:complete
MCKIRRTLRVNLPLIRRWQTGQSLPFFKVFTRGEIMKFILPIFVVMALSACDNKEDDTAADTAASAEDTAAE